MPMPQSERRAFALMIACAAVAVGLSTFGVLEMESVLSKSLVDATLIGRLLILASGWAGGIGMGAVLFK